MYAFSACVILHREIYRLWGCRCIYGTFHVCHDRDSNLSLSIFSLTNRFAINPPLSRAIAPTIAYIACCITITWPDLTGSVGYK
jgi:hypothetical protein